MKFPKKHLLSIILVGGILLTMIPSSIYVNALQGVLSKLDSNASEEEIYLEKKNLSASDLIDEIFEAEKELTTAEDKIVLLPHYTALLITKE